MSEVQELTRLIVVRHGETEWNAERRFMGWLDRPLTPRGQEQAARVAERLAATGFDAMVSSDLGRAMTTAQAIAARAGQEVLPCPALRERGLGVMQGHTLEEIQQRHPEVFAGYRGDPDYVVPDGESFRGFHGRVVGGFESLVEEHRGKRIVAVAHGGTLDSLFRHVVGQPLGEPRRVRLLNASVNIAEVVQDQWILHTWGDVGHLTP
jgi:probable phosphoglycerate mutase